MSFVMFYLSWKYVSYVMEVYYILFVTRHGCVTSVTQCGHMSPVTCHSGVSLRYVMRLSVNLFHSTQMQYTITNKPGKSEVLYVVKSYNLVWF